jgi:hypothetical protein
MPKRIAVLEYSLQITELEICRRDVADFFRTIPEDDIEAAFINAVEVGVFCLQRAHMSQDTEFVRRQVESVLNALDAAANQIPGAIQKALLEKVGTKNGQVLAPVEQTVNAASKAMQDKMKEVRAVLDKDIDPAKETSTLGRALTTVKQLLDPKRSDSVQKTLEEAVKSVTKRDGALAKVVKEVVTETIKPLADEVDALAKEVRGQEAAEEALAQTTRKGFAYEDEVVERLQKWAEHNGVEVHAVGADNRPGDVVLRVDGDSLLAEPVTVVVEAKDKQNCAGRKTITDILSRAMAERNANAAVYVTKARDGLAVEIGDWAEGTTDRGPFVACINENLALAVRWLLIHKRIAQLRATSPQIDSTAIEAQLQRIQTALQRVKTINNKVTAVRTGADAIQQEAETLRDEIRAALAEIEGALMAAPAAVVKKKPAAAARS